MSISPIIVLITDRFSTDQSHTTLSSRSLYLHPGDLTLDSPSAHQSSGDEFGSFPNAGDHSNSSSQPTSACVPSKSQIQIGEKKIS